MPLQLGPGDTANSVRSAKHVQHVERVKAALALEAELGKVDGAPEPVFISMQDQASLVGFYESKIMDVCKAFRKKGFQALVCVGRARLTSQDAAKDPTVQATAIAYFKRFYLYHSVMDYDPKQMLIVSLFLAAKVENASIPLNEFLSIIPSSPSIDQVKDLEFELSEGLNFEYKVHHPFWPLHGFFLDMQAYLKQVASSKDSLNKIAERLGDCYKKAKDYASDSLLTDIMLTQSPTQIAIACLLAAARETEFIEDFESYLQHRLLAPSEQFANTLVNDRVKQQAVDQTKHNEVKIEAAEEEKDIDAEFVFSMLKSRLSEMESMIKAARSSVATKAHCQQIDVKLKSCRNPEFLADSLVYAKRRHDQQQLAERKRAKKIKGASAMRNEDEAVFQ